MAQREDWGRSPPQERVLYVAPPSIERLTVPLLLVVSALCFVGWATWFGTTAINKIQENITEISNNLKNYIERSDARVLRIEEALDKRTDERLTKFDHGDLVPPNRAPKPKLEVRRYAAAPQRRDGESGHLVR